MHWKPNYWQLGETRIKFAWLPKLMIDGTLIWLESYSATLIWQGLTYDGVVTIFKYERMTDDV